MEDHSNGRGKMIEKSRVVTANLSAELVSGMDEAAKQIDRSKSWIIRQAVKDWLAEHQRRNEVA
jgi:predicted transcriptional regulator